MFVEDAERKLVFMELMKEAVGDILEEMGERPEWPDDAQPAPEHERLAYRRDDGSRVRS